MYHEILLQQKLQIYPGIWFTTEVLIIWECKLRPMSRMRAGAKKVGKTFMATYQPPSCREEWIRCPQFTTMDNITPRSTASDQSNHFLQQVHQYDNCRHLFPFSMTSMLRDLPYMRLLNPVLHDTYSGWPFSRPTQLSELLQSRTKISLSMNEEIEPQRWPSRMLLKYAKAPDSPRRSFPNHA